MNTFQTFMQAKREANWPQWLHEAAALQKIEGNPLSEEQIQLFESFEARGLSHEERHAEIDAWFARKYGVAASA